MLRVYLAGPMRGLPEFNYPAFDEAKAEWESLGWSVASPASLDRAVGLKVDEGSDPAILRRAMSMDIACIYCATAIALLPGWEKSTGVAVELSLAKFLGLAVYDAVTKNRITVVDHPYYELKLLGLPTER